MRVQVNINDKLVKQIDDYADTIGMSRSGLCAYFIGQGIFSVMKGIEFANSAIDNLVQSNQIDGQMELQECVAELENLRIAGKQAADPRDA